MKQIKDYQIEFSTKDLKEQVEEFFYFYQKKETASHSLEVAMEAKKLARRFNVSEEKAYKAGLLHDISVVIPNEERVSLQKELGAEVLEVERELPMILHQKQSVFIAKEIFKIEDEDILSAIECHTTLKRNASDLDKVIFIADKVKWDRDDRAPYLDELVKVLDYSLDEACRIYINWALTDIVVMHPWLEQAMVDLGIGTFN